MKNDIDEVSIGLLLPTFICHAGQISLIFYRDRDLCVERANQLSLINGRILRLARIRARLHESAGRIPWLANNKSLLIMVGRRLLAGLINRFGINRYEYVAGAAP
jgi:hypothetical protein